MTTAPRRVVSVARPAGPSWLADVLYPILAALAVFAAAISLLLAITPLWETPDTNCQRVLSPPPSGSGCGDIVVRREHWIAIVIGIAVLLAAATVAARRRRSAGRRTPRGVMAILALSVVLGIAGAGFLTIGDNYRQCGSTLSRIDPGGDFNRPQECASTYAASRIDAWILGLLAAAFSVAAMAFEARRQAIPRSPISTS